MAEVNTDKGKSDGKKGKQKKVNIRVDFTPMVDMNMLLITFFMICTSLSKPQTMEISMPSKDHVTEAEQTKVKASKAITLILGEDSKVYYYFGEPDYEHVESLKTTIENIASAKAKLSYIEIKAKEKGYPLYLIVDEYDNFTNVILSEHGQKMFHDLTHASGFYREYFKQFKGMFDRIFLMGVSPITLDDLSSGYNIDWNDRRNETVV